MIRNIFEKIEIEHLISENDTVLIALSGGADSVFLTEYLLSIREKYSLTLKAAHVEHGIRGEESLSDCAFVENYCKEHDIECFVLHINAVEEARENGIGVEEYSRKRRYEFFSSIKCDKIATAHNLTDNAETIIFRLIRGTSIKGMCGIPQKRNKIIRPLLNITGDEIRKLLDDNGITYCLDSTNQSNEYSRNHIRNQIMPLFGDINSDYVGALSRFIYNVKQDNDFIESCSKTVFDKALDKNALDIKILREYHISVIKRVIIRYFSLNGLSLDEKHISDAVKLVFAPSKMQISGNIFAVSNKRTFRIAELSNNDEGISFSFTQKKYILNDFLNICELSYKQFDFFCDCDRIIGSVSVRSRKAGDVISPAGRHCTKTLKKLFNELSIPVENRHKIPVIADDNGVIGIYGYFADERVSICKSTKNVLALNVSTEDKF